MEVGGPAVLPSRPVPECLWNLSGCRRTRPCSMPGGWLVGCPYRHSAPFGVSFGEPAGGARAYQSTGAGRQTGGGEGPRRRAVAAQPSCRRRYPQCPTSAVSIRPVWHSWRRNYADAFSELPMIDWPPFLAHAQIGVCFLRALPSPHRLRIACTAGDAERDGH